MPFNCDQCNEHTISVYPIIDKGLTKYVCKECFLSHYRGKKPKVIKEDFPSIGIDGKIKEISKKEGRG